MRSIGRMLALALLVVPAFARAEDKGTTTTTGQSTTPREQPRSAMMPSSEQRSGAGATTMEGNRDAASASASADTEKMTDARFVALMHHVNQEEIAAGKLAEQKGHSADIKKYGKRLVTDHQKNDQQLMSAAKKAGVKVEESALSTKDREEAKVDQNKMDQVKQMSGAEFDRTFAQVMSNDHDHVAKMVKDHKADLKSKDLQTYADKTLPVLEQHKDLADKAMKSEKQASAGSNQGRSPSALDRRTRDTSSANKGNNPEGNRGDASAKSGAPNPEKQ